MFSERAGVINIALEGLMLAGAFTAAAVTYYAGNPWVGLLAGDSGGGGHRGHPRRRLHPLQGRPGRRGHGHQHPDAGRAGAPERRVLPLVGLDAADCRRSNLIPWTPIFIAFLLVPVTWYVLYRTPFGLRLRAVGENPEAADAAGVSVKRMRYTAVLLSGALAGIGGAYLSIGQSSLFTRNMSAGRGFIALAALIFGKWRPVQTMLACLLFGFTEAVAIQLQGVHHRRRGDSQPVHPDHPLRADHRRPRRLHRPLARPARPRHPVPEGEVGGK